MTPENKERLKLLWKTLLHKNETTSLILKAHLFSEQLLNLILLDYYNNSRASSKTLNKGYKKKLNLVSKHNLLPQKCTLTLNRLNKLRNKCAHTLNFSPSDLDVLNIVEPFAKDWQSINSTPNPEMVIERLMCFLCGYMQTESELQKNKKSKTSN